MLLALQAAKDVECFRTESWRLGCVWLDGAICSSHGWSRADAKGEVDSAHSWNGMNGPLRHVINQ